MRADYLLLNRMVLSHVIPAQGFDAPDAISFGKRHSSDIFGNFLIKDLWKKPHDSWQEILEVQYPILATRKTSAQMATNRSDNAPLLSGTTTTLRLSKIPKLGDLGQSIYFDLALINIPFG